MKRHIARHMPSIDHIYIYVVIHIANRYIIHMPGYQ